MSTVVLFGCTSMPICSPGVSRPKAISPAVVFLIGETATALAIETLGLSAVWASLLAYAAGETISTIPFCASDPPAMPTFTAADILTILTSSAAVNPDAFAKLGALIQIAAWYVFCECSPAPTPAAPTGPAYPPGAPMVNPPQAPTPTANACWDKQIQLTVPANTGGPEAFFDLTTQLLPANTPTLTVTRISGHPQQAYSIPTGANTLTMTVTPQQASSFFNIEWLLWNHDASAGQSFPGFFEWNGSGGAITLTIPTINAGMLYWSIEANGGGSSATTDETFSIECSYFCAGTSPTSPVQPCCPPDPILSATLQTILQLVTLIQRQSTPFAYLRSTVHSGLTGIGELTVQGLIGISIQPTAFPGPIGSEEGDPIEFFDMGWFCWGTSDGFDNRIRLTHSPQVSTPVEAGQYTLVGYSFPPGLTCTITELLREP